MDVTWFLLQEDLTEEEDTGFLGDSPSLGEHKEMNFRKKYLFCPERQSSSWRLPSLGDGARRAGKAYKRCGFG